jgi:hemerythrin-like metal-binding protein
MEWESDFNCNIETIDQQHRKLVDIINLLYETLESRTKNDMHALVETLSKEADAINDMLRYTLEHFKYEEKMMLDYTYPQYNEHKEMHDSFTSKAKIYKNHFDSAIEVNVNEMMAYLKEWLRNHILVEDKKFVPYVKK